MKQITLTVQFLLLITLFLSLSIFNNCEFIGKNDKVEVELIYAKHVFEDPDSLLKVYMNTVKYNRTNLAFNMNATFSEPFDHTYELDFESQVWGDGGWKRNFFHFQKNDPCKNIGIYFGQLWLNLLKTIGAPPHCPIPAGFYHTENYYLDFSHIPLIIQSGRFLTKIIFLKNKKIVADLEGEIIVRKKVLHFVK